MDIAESIKKVIQELIVPELNIIKTENREIKTVLDLTNKRLDDLNGHLVDQSRRIDETNKRIDDTNGRIDHLRVELRDELGKMSMRIDRLYEVIVRKEDHEKLERRVEKLEQNMAEIRARIAA